MRLIELYPPETTSVIGQKTFTAEAIIRFAEKFDPQPFHLDADAARDYVFGALCASGWHTCAEWMRCLCDFLASEHARLTAEGLAPPKTGPSPGFTGLQWLKPVYAGDTITYSIRMLETRPLASRPGWHLNLGLSEGVNQHGEPVLRFNSKILEFE